MSRTWMFLLILLIHTEANTKILYLRLITPDTGNARFLSHIAEAVVTQNGIKVSKTITPVDALNYFTIENLNDTSFSVSLNIFDSQQKPIACCIEEAEIDGSDTTFIDFRLLEGYSKGILISNIHRKKAPTSLQLLGMNLQNCLHTIKRYENETLFTEKVHQAKQQHLPWFMDIAIDSAKLDSNMIPWRTYYFGTFRNPVTICSFAFGFHQQYLQTGDETACQAFLNNVNWLYKNRDRNFYLHFDFDWHHFPDLRLPAGWISAMAQAGALGAMSMAYHLTEDPIYLHGANGFFSTLMINTDTYWCFGVDEENYYWLEEYPNEDFCHVLNGMLYALWGIWDYYVISENPDALALFSASIRTIADHYPEWNISHKNHSLYCRHQCAYEAYHKVQVGQLQKYYDFFKIPEFKEAIELFTEEPQTGLISKQKRPEIKSLTIFPNYPNPFNANTTIRYFLSQSGRITIRIFDIRGRQVATLLDEDKDSNHHSILWNGKTNSGEDAASGIYFCQIRAGNEIRTIKLVLIR